MLILLIFALVTLPFLALLALLRPSEPKHHSLSKRNPCDGIGFPQIELYEDYTEPMCPAPNHLDDQGNCEDFDNTEQDCASFCQLTTTYVWARESPFFGSECHYPMRCKLRVTDSTKWSLDGFVAADAQFDKALGVGITGGLGSSWGHINGHVWSITPQPGECGYFTWVPVTKRTCGTVTSSLKIGTSSDGWKCLNMSKTVQDICHDQVWYLKGRPDGVVIWVRTDCSTGQPLGAQDQDTVYNSPGVSLYEISGPTMFDGWSTNTCVMNVIKAVSNGIWYDLRVTARGLELGMIGNNGELLLNRINACGDISSWNFTWADVAYPNSTWDMTASSTIFVRESVSKDCIGTALVQAGGVADKCE